MGEDERTLEVMEVKGLREWERAGRVPHATEGEMDLTL